MILPVSVVPDRQLLMLTITIDVSITHAQSILMKSGLSECGYYSNLTLLDTNNA